MASPDDGVRLQRPFDERGLFVPPSPGQPVSEPTAVSVLRPALPSPFRRQPDWRSLPAQLRTSAPRAIRLALVTEWERGTAFLFAPVLLAAGAFAYFASDREPSLGSVAACAAAMAALTFVSRSRLVLHLAFAALLCVTLGTLSAKIETMRADTKVLGGEISTRLTGRVAVIEHQDDGRIRMTIDVLKTERPKLRYAPRRVRVSARSIPDGLLAGDVVSGVARMGPPSGPTRPDGYDFSFNSYFDGIGANGFFLTAPERSFGVYPAPPGTRFLALVENLRTALANRIRAAIGGAEGEIAAALVAGVRGGIPEDVNESLRRTGLAHVLSISGLHMALVAATIMLVLRAGFALFPDFASRRPVKKYAAIAALVTLCVYLFISGMAVAAERSFIMLGVMLVAALFDRAALTMRNLAISAIAIIAVSPHEVAGPSFQMSFAATAALIGVYAGWAERRRGRTPANAGAGRLRRMVRHLGFYGLGLATTSLIAGVATAVFGAYHFQRVSPLSLGANLAAMPFVSVIVMPFAMLAMILMPFGLDGWAFALMGKGLTVMIAIADWFSALSPIDSVGLIPGGAVIAVTIALVLATLPTTWLRIAAVPAAMAGLLMIAGRTLPLVLVSEDARLVALRSDNDAIAVNRARPNAFTTDDWQRTLKAATIVKPDVAAADAPAPAEPIVGRFRCSGASCIARTLDRALVAHVADPASAGQYCSQAALIVIDDATAKHPCPAGTAAVLTKRDLARRGSASVTFADGSAGPTATITFAISEPYRPWHAHRAFSRAARGMAPYQRKGSARPVTGVAAATKGVSATTMPTQPNPDQ